MFKICARTVLELGAELISSDVIAFYELIKNAFDAGSSSGAEIRFEVALRRNDYLRFRQTAVAGAVGLDTMKSNVVKALDQSASNDSIASFRARIDGVNSADQFVAALDASYVTENRIVVSDQGTGMSREGLIANYLVIGTASRKRAINAALQHGPGYKQRPPFLGEKGIGRLSAMRLGDRLKVETAQQTDERLNLLSVDWRAFAELDAMLDDIDLTPEPGPAKPSSDWSGTRLTIDALTADWTYHRVHSLAQDDFARLTDPFADAKRRPRIAIYWNGRRVSVARMDRTLLAHAHASVRGSYRTTRDGPTLECRLEAIDLGFEHPRETQKRVFDQPDLEGLIPGISADIPRSALFDVGDFDFEAYWFNRRRLGSIDSIGNQARVRALQEQWSGILLFRDGFRILPYGENDDDWLALDRRALASTGYLLNKAQFVGRVRTSRLGNPKLVDQTNREGLRECPEQQAFLRILQLAIQWQLRDFLRDLQLRYKAQPGDPTEAKTEVARLEQRAKSALRQMRRIAPEAAALLEDLQHAFSEIKELYARVQDRIVAVEGEKRQMVQMAGVGMLVEVVAHELARATENALATLDALQEKDVSGHLGGLLRSLRSEMKSVSKRLRTLDPLSVAGRQRKETFDLRSLITDTIDGHRRQFERHAIQLSVTLPGKPLRIRAVKGMIVQIVENLVSNSLYWLDVRQHNESRFQPRIAIVLSSAPLELSFEDNGSGIAQDNRDNVFRAFFSLKEETKRRGLGLYIARDCAEYNGGRLTLDERLNPDTGRLHRFVLTLPDSVVVL